MPKNKMQDLRNHLFETLEALKDKDESMAVDRAKAVSNVAQAIIHSVKVELDFIKLTGERDATGDFFDTPMFDTPGKPTVPTLLRKLGS